MPENRVDVVHLAADERCSPVQHGSRERLAAKYGIRSSYIFNLGTIEPRKNLKRLIQAYAMLPAARKAECSLVIGGGGGWLNSDIYRYVQDNGLGQYVKLIGRVDDEDLPALYTSCEVFVYPSMYEGFGLPVLEAMACGAPVITSRTSSLPEVAGDAAILVDPEDVRSIRDAMEDLLTNPGQRSILREKGFKQSKRFSWRRTAQETLGVYERIAKAPGAAVRS
jgi:glycosyltransferase involved in cell wall biosynthesis